MSSIAELAPTNEEAELPYHPELPVTESLMAESEPNTPEVATLHFGAPRLIPRPPDLRLPDRIPKGYGKRKKGQGGQNKEGIGGAIRDNGLRLLLQEARKHPLLSATQEIDLAKRIERGDLEAKEELVNSNLLLVIANARRYIGRGLPLEDLAQEGTMGLIRAAEKFDWRRGYKFSTYATWWIRRALQQSLEEKSRAIRLPRHAHALSMKMNKAEAKLAAKFGRDPTIDELADVLAKETDAITDIRNADSVISLDRNVGNEEDTPRIDLVADDGLEEMPDIASGKERAEAVRRAVEELDDPRQREAIRRLYLDERDEFKKDIARDLGIAPQSLPKVERQALAALSADENLILKAADQHPNGRH